MCGFSGILIHTDYAKEALKTFRFPANLGSYFSLKEELAQDHVSIALYTNGKFEKTKCLIPLAEGLLGLEGIFLDYPDGLDKIQSILFQPSHDQQSKVLNLPELEKVKGSFAGFHLKGKEITLFTDPMGSRAIFYYHSRELTAFSSSIFQLRDILRHFGKHYSLDEQAAYMLGSLGYLLEDYTLIREIRKVTAGKVVRFTATELQETRYHSFFRPTEHVRITSDLLTELDSRFCRSVRSEFELDVRNGYQHLATLSGGLDSRMNVMFAHAAGFHNQTCITFSEGFLDDELIAREITDQLKLRHIILLLNNGHHLFHPEVPLFLNNCSVYYFGAAQTYYAITSLSTKNAGLLHNGGLAESSKGGYLSTPYYRDPCIDPRYAVSRRLLLKVDEVFQKIKTNYPNEEQFIQYNRGFNAIHNGTWMTAPFTDSYSAFMEQDFASLAFSIDPKLRYDGYLTVEWLNRLHPEMSRFRWSKYGIRPTNNRSRITAARLKNKVTSMLNPFRVVTNTNEKWIIQNPDFIDFIQASFRQARCMRWIGNDLRADLITLFTNGNANEKLLCLSLLRSIDLLFDA